MDAAYRSSKRSGQITKGNIHGDGGNQDGLQEEGRKWHGEGSGCKQVNYVPFSSSHAFVLFSISLCIISTDGSIAEIEPKDIEDAKKLQMHNSIQCYA